MFLNTFELFQNFLTYLEITFSIKNIKFIIAKMLVQLPGILLIAIWNLFTKTYLKFVTLHPLFKSSKKYRKFFKIVRKNWKNSHGFRKINEFIWNTKNIGYLIIYWTIVFFTNSLIILQNTLLCKITVLDSFKDIWHVHCVSKFWFN